MSEHPRERRTRRNAFPTGCSKRVAFDLRATRLSMLAGPHPVRAKFAIVQGRSIPADNCSIPREIVVMISFLKSVNRRNRFDRLPNRTRRNRARRLAVESLEYRL